MWKLFGRSQAQPDRYSVATLAALHQQLSKEQKMSVSEKARVQTVESLRTIAELIIWGDKHEPAIFEYVLENNVLARALPDFVDAWSTVFPKNRGLTFDGATNQWVRDRGERMRYDRVMVRRSLGRPVAAERLGTTPAGDGLFASDHFGLRVDVVML